jgi:hypothetical protein
MKTKILCAAVLLSWAPGVRGLYADVTVGLHVDDGEVKDFHLALGAHFGCPRAEIVAIRKLKVSDEELPVVLYLSTMAHVTPHHIVKMRLAGRSWMQITAHFGLTGGIFYVPVVGVYGPPFGRAYGHFKNRKRSEWGVIRLSDADIVHLANVKFLSKHYRCSPDDVIKAHVKGRGFVKLHGRVKVHGARMKAGVKVNGGGLKVKGSGVKVNGGGLKVKGGGVKLRAPGVRGSGVKFSTGGGRGGKMKSRGGGGRGKRK